MNPEDDFFDVDPADYPALCCHRCSGTGEISDDESEGTCPECDGTGWPETAFPE